MCYKKPGPRCSPHAEQKVLEARHNLSLAKEQKKSLSELGKLSNILRAAWYDFDETPKGQRLLVFQISYEIESDKKRRLILRKEKAWKRRVRKLELLELENNRYSGETKFCPGCNNDLPIEEFSLHVRKRDGRQSRCKKCRIKINKDYYKKTPEKNTARKATKGKRYEIVRNIVLEHLSNNPCIDCNNSTLECLEFDHVRGDKIANISDFLSGNEKPRVQEGMLKDAVLLEIEKCDVRCGNCHRIKTSERYKNSKRIRYREGKKVPERYKVFYDSMSDGCVDCNEKNIIVLELDHVRGQKVANVSQMLRGNFSLENIQKEISKCETRCVNCHKKATKARSTLL